MLFLKNLKFHQFCEQLEKGTIPNGEILKKIADYFEVSIDSLLDFDENVSVRLSSKNLF